MKNDSGFTLIEVILTISVVCLIIMPLMFMLVMSAKANNESDMEYRSFLAAQSCMEEIKAMKIVDDENYIYSLGDEFEAEIRIMPESPFYYLIDINILDNDKIINTLRGSMLVR